MIVRQSIPEQELLRIVWGLPNFAVYMLDEGGHVAGWNPGAERMKGYREDEILGRHFSVFYPPEALAAGTPERLLALARQEGQSEDEGWRLRKDGTRFWANVVITAVHDVDEHLRGFAKATRDLTVRKRSEEDRLALARSEEALRLRNEFIAIASHDLRTPLNTLTLSLAIAEAADGGPALRSSLDNAKRQVGKLAKFVERLLDVTRIVEGRLPLVLGETVAVSSIVAQVIATLRGEAMRAGSEITARLPSGLVGRFDALRLGQLFTNLIENAIKFGRGKPIEVAAGSEDGFLVATVRDSGRGIPAADLGRVFARFERGSSGTPGFGLGLYIAREIAEQHGGSIQVESTPDVGSTFTVRLPLDGPRSALRKNGGIWG